MSVETNQARRHAVVVGANMSGLLAARMLTDFFQHVTLLERHQPPTPARPRRTTPPKPHPYGPLPRAPRALQSLFPTLIGDLAAAGMPPAEFIRQAELALPGCGPTRGDNTAAPPGTPKAALEAAVRDQVASLAGVTLIGGCHIAGPLSHHGRVSGMRIRRAHSTHDEVIEADLVVDTTNHTAQEPVGSDRSSVRHILEIATPDQVLTIGTVPGTPIVMGLGPDQGDRWLFTPSDAPGDPGRWQPLIWVI